MPPETAHYAVIFTSTRRTAPGDGYDETADRMEELAREQPGFLGIESARGADGLGITVSYWASLEAVGAWGGHAEHLLAQRRGRDEWYASYTLRVCQVVHTRDFARPATGDPS
jgi:heme-degrading monooxygenase HmoA